jgi:protein-L-isoaspartate(D-aspartate) O-methyltransferase
MTDYTLARENMIESQVRPNGITDHRIIDAMAGLAREAFVPDSRRPVAYVDEDIPLTDGAGGEPRRFLVEAMAFARLVQLAEIKAEDKVLHVGAASGYGTAVLARMAGQVVAVESDGGLASQARERLAGSGNVTVVEGPLGEGCKAEAPYDVILIEGRVGEIPQALIAQLGDGGRLVTVVGEGDVGKAEVLTRSGGSVAVRQAFDASIAPLPGFARRRPAFVF